MFDTILAIWPVPPDHRVKIEHEQLDTSITVEIADLIAAGLLAPGQVLYSQPGKYGGRSGRILSNGRIDVEGKVFENPSSAAVHIRQKPTNGWDFWRLDPSGGRPLNEVRAEYLRVVSLEGAEEEDDVPAESD